MAGANKQVSKGADKTAPEQPNAEEAKAIAEKEAAAAAKALSEKEAEEAAAAAAALGNESDDVYDVKLIYHARIRGEWVAAGKTVSVDKQLADELYAVGCIAVTQDEDDE